VHSAASTPTGTRLCLLAIWQSAAWCAELSGEISRIRTATACGVDERARVPFLLEYDRGTESGSRLAEKLDGDRDFLAEAISPTWLLSRFPTMGREVTARRVLVEAQEANATAVLPGGTSPAEAIRLLMAGSDRLRLARLVDSGKRPAAETSPSLFKSGLRQQRKWKRDTFAP
jgi:hypothetical protein